MTEEFLATQVLAEMKRAVSKFGIINSAHEGYAVIKEELEELWDNVKLKPSNPKRDIEIYREAIQVAAMAIRMIIDCVPRKIYRA